MQEPNDAKHNQGWHEFKRVLDNRFKIVTYYKIKVAETRYDL